MDLDVAELRRRLARPAAAASIYGDDRDEREVAGNTAAAVLVPIIAHPEGLTVLFTRRTTQLKAHSGQVSFPGGRAEPGDPSPQHTALREAEEEIGLAPSRVEVLGQPLAFVLDPATHRRESRQIGARMATYYVIEHHGRTIWGATAGMLVNLYRQLAA